MQPPAATVTSNTKTGVLTDARHDPCLPAITVSSMWRSMQRLKTASSVAAPLAIGTATRDTDSYSECVSASTRVFKWHAQRQWKFISCGMWRRVVERFPTLGRNVVPPPSRTGGPFLLKPQSLKTKVTSLFETPGNAATRRHKRQDMNPQHTKILRIIPAVSPQHTCNRGGDQEVARLLECDTVRFGGGVPTLQRVPVTKGIPRHMTELSRKRVTPATLLVVPVFTELKYALIQY